MNEERRKEIQETLDLLIALRNKLARLEITLKEELAEPEKKQP